MELCNSTYRCDAFNVLGSLLVGVGVIEAKVAVTAGLWQPSPRHNTKPVRSLARQHKKKKLACITESGLRRADQTKHTPRLDPPSTSSPACNNCRSTASRFRKVRQLAGPSAAELQHHNSNVNQR